MPGRIIVTSVFLWPLLLACGGTGEVAPIQVRAVQSEATEDRTRNPEDHLLVLVRGFTDQRRDVHRLGVRTHLGGSTTLFDVPEGSLHDVLTGVVVEYMKQQGATVVVCPHGVPCEIDPKPDLVISGRIVEFSANAKSSPFSTRLTTHIKVTMEAEERARGRVRKKHLVGMGEDAVFWFEAQDLEDLVNDTLHEALKQPLADLRTSLSVAQRRPRPEQ